MKKLKLKTANAGTGATLSVSSRPTWGFAALNVRYVDAKARHDGGVAWLTLPMVRRVRRALVVAERELAAFERTQRRDRAKTAARTRAT